MDGRDSLFEPVLLGQKRHRLITLSPMARAGAPAERRTFPLGQNQGLGLRQTHIFLSSEGEELPETCFVHA
jgi:hypothetical protein